MKRSLVLLVGLLLAEGSLAAAVHLQQHVDVDDARLYLSIQGRDHQAPLLIWLHGGPGGAERPLFRLYNTPLEQRFVVAYLDQRGTGRSFNRQEDPARLTIAQHLADLSRVIEFLLNELGPRPVVLVGHSWGSALGLLYAQAHPGEIAAFVGVGQVTSELARQWSQYRFVKAEALRRGESANSARIEAIGIPPFAVEQELAMQRFVQRYGGYWRDRPSLFKLMAKAAFRGYAMPWELPRLIEGNNVSLHAMHDELLRLDLRERVTSVEVPVIFMLGRYDRQVDPCLAAAYFDTLTAPEKRLKWFDTAHNVPFEAAEEFNDSLPQLLESMGILRPRMSSYR